MLHHTDPIKMFAFITTSPPKKKELQNPDTVACKSSSIPRDLRSQTLVLSFRPWLDDDANY